MVVSAHILCYTPTSVVQLLNKTKKAFFIDPMTFVFARDLENITRNGKIRRSYKKLVDEYGAPFSNCLNGNQLIPSLFKDGLGKLDESTINHMCKAVLALQWNKCNVPTSFSKYDILLKKGIELKPVRPKFLLPPYFFANQYGDDWYMISLKCAQLSRDLKTEAELYPVICISKDILWDLKQISSIVKDYEGFDGYILWIDALNEENIFPNELTGLKTLVAELAKYQKPIYSLYGGYLFDLLGKFGLTGYASGICYGERRSVDAKGGGAGNRYYIPNAHLKISEDLANAFFSESDKNRKLMCSCPTCSDILKSLPSSLSPQDYVDRFFTQMEFLDFRRHFVNVKFEEVNTRDTMNDDQVVNSLDIDIQRMSDIDGFPGQPPYLDARHLRVWKTLFS